MIGAAPVENPAGYKFSCTDPPGCKCSCTDRGSTGFPYAVCTAIWLTSATPQFTRLGRGPQLTRLGLPCPGEQIEGEFCKCESCLGSSTSTLKIPLNRYPRSM